jgi:hypothetical protein
MSSGLDRSVSWHLTSAGALTQSSFAHLDAGYRLARWLMRDERDAEDMVQEASLPSVSILPDI